MRPENEMVYIVDDEAIVRDGLSSLLRAKGKDVRLFACGTEFLKFERKDAALVLSSTSKCPA
jgi:FixJ family two-component response regulator